MSLSLVIKLRVELHNFLSSKNQQAMKGRISEHQEVSLKMCEQVKGTLFTSVRNDQAEVGCKIVW